MPGFSRLTIFPVILVRRAGRGNVVGDLRPAGMRPGQRSSEGDAGAGDLARQPSAHE